MNSRRKSSSYDIFQHTRRHQNNFHRSGSSLHSHGIVNEFLRNEIRTSSGFCAKRLTDTEWVIASRLRCVSPLTVLINSHFARFINRSPLARFVNGVANSCAGLCGSIKGINVVSLSNGELATPFNSPIDIMQLFYWRIYTTVECQAQRTTSVVGSDTKRTTYKRAHIEKSFMKSLLISSTSGC